MKINGIHDVEKVLEMGKSSSGSWSRHQLESIGIPWPLKKGWKKSIIGHKLSKAQIEVFISLKDAHKRKIDSPLNSFRSAVKSLESARNRYRDKLLKIEAEYISINGMSPLELDDMFWVERYHLSTDDKIPVEHVVLNSFKGT